MELFLAVTANEKQWIPPGFRACTWDEAQWMNTDGGLRAGLSNGHGQALSWHRGAGDCITWLCIDTPKPRHAHEKPWVKLGFEECEPEAAELARNTDGHLVVRVWIHEEGEGQCTLCPEGTLSARYTPIRPSLLFGLKRALEILERDGYSALEGCVGYEIRAEIAKYEHPVCPGCKREMP